MYIKTVSRFSIVIAFTVLLTSAMGFADTEVRGLIAQDGYPLDGG